MRDRTRAILDYCLFGLVDAVTCNGRWGNGFARVCRNISDRITGDNDSRMWKNGEFAYLKNNLHDGDVVFDVGAHIGEWARMCLAILPSIRLHCFEPSRFTFQLLAAENLPPSARLNNCGLGSAEGPATLRITAEGHPTNSLYLREGVPGMSWANGTEAVELTTLDGYCAANGIPQIDLLKIDTEGHELEVLRGASQMLAQGKIGLIQFEYGATFIDARILLKDIFAFLKQVCPQARLWKILPYGLRKIPAYAQDLETLVHSTYLVGIARDPERTRVYRVGAREAPPSPLYLANHYVKHASQSLSAYRDVARSRRRLGKNASYSEEATARLVRERLAHLQPKPRGKLRILFISYGPPGYDDANLCPALKEFGELILSRSGLYPGQCSAVEWRRERGRINRNLLAGVEKMPCPPDLILGHMRGWLIDPDTLRHLRAKKIPIVNYSWDDTVAFYGTRMDGVWSGLASLAPLVDLNLTSSKRNCLKYQAEGGLALFWPEAANPEIHRPVEVPREYDVSFVGGRYGYRPLLIDFLRRHGVRVAAFGPGWEGGTLSQEEMVALYSRSRINLGFGGIGHTVRIQHLKGRDFEIPMSGGLYLTSFHSELAECYEIGKEIACYRDKWDCLDKIRHLLRHPEEAAAIARAGRQRALRDHTWKQRLDRLFHWVGLL